MSKCRKKHPTDIPDDEWMCPRCGAGPEEGYVLEYEVGTEAECEYPHASDLVSCGNCEYHATYGTVAKLYDYQKSLVVCPTCKGNGKIRPS